MMLACNETITHIQRNYNNETDSDYYVCTVIKGVSWYGKLKANIDTKGMRGETLTTVRIPEEAMPDITIYRGDIIVRGEVTIEKQSDLKKLEHFMVLSIGDNRRSNQKELRHWAVSGA